MSVSKHTCVTSGRSNCQPCMEFEVDLWDAINRYAVSVGGDPASHVYDNVPRMQAVADVGKIVDRVAVRHNAVAAQACETGPVYETAKELAQMWRDQRTASFELLDRLAAQFDSGGDK